MVTYRYPRARAEISLLGIGLAYPFLFFSLCCIGSTHKRTEGRAPVWGSEFTSKLLVLLVNDSEYSRSTGAKSRCITGGFRRNRCWAKCKIVGFGNCSGGAIPGFWNT
jgi:hypothetical protein